MWPPLFSDPASVLARLPGRLATRPARTARRGFDSRRLHAPTQNENRLNSYSAPLVQVEDAYPETYSRELNGAATRSVKKVDTVLMQVQPMTPAPMQRAVPQSAIRMSAQPGKPAPVQPAKPTSPLA